MYKIDLRQHKEDYERFNSILRNLQITRHFQLH